MPITKVKQERFYAPKPPDLTEDDDPRSPVLVHVSDLVIDQNEQRGVIPLRLERMGDWDWEVTEGVTVALRDNGDLVVIEGQHRITKKRDENPQARMWVLQLDGVHDAAAIALKIARSRKAHSAYDQWILEWRMGGELQRLATDVMANLQLELSSQTNQALGAHKIAAVAAIKSIMLMKPDLDEGADLLDTTLSLIKAAFGDQPKMWETNLLKAVSQLIARNDLSPYQLERMVGVLGSQPPKLWLAETNMTRAGQSKPGRIAEAIRDAFNHGRQPGTRIQ